MQDRYKLTCVGVVCLTGYGIAALALGHNGTIMTSVIVTIGGLIAGCIGFAWGKLS